MTKKIAFYTFGCKQNQFETEGMREILAKNGFEITSFDTFKADIFVVNTCTVTAKADMHARQLVRRIGRLNPKAQIIVTGCYAQRDPSALTELPQVKVVCGNLEKKDILSIIQLTTQSEPSVLVENITQEKKFDVFALTEFGGHTRAFVKIQDGCNAACSYCVIPSVRGKSRSLEPGLALDLIKRLVANGYQEIVLSGIHIGMFGRDLAPKTTLTDLIQRIIEIPDLRRVRLGSIEPNTISDSLIELVASSPKICRHFHIPLQSGSDRIIKAMKRPFNRERFKELITRIVTQIPSVGIGCDVIVGFPGEEEEDFRQSYDLIEALPIAYLHVFNFSRREGTIAYDLPNQVNPEIRKHRSKELRALSRHKQRLFRKGFIGQTLPCLFLERRHKQTGLLEAISDNYIDILVDDSDVLFGQFHTVIIESVEGGQAYGRIDRKAH